MSKLLITNKLSDNRFLTPEGYMVIKNCILSKVGAQEYRKNEVFSCDSDEIISINRTEEEVFNENSLASFTGKPITLEHPSTDVNPENHNELSMGHIIEVRRRVLPDGTKVVEGDIMITNQEAIDIIQDGEMTDLSVGYDCDIVDEENPQQRNIRVNHLALCKEGRAGIAHIADSKMKDYQLPSESFKRMENIPIQARKELKESDNPKATLLSYKSAIEDIINSADPDICNKLKSMGDKIINDLKNQFKIDDSVEDMDRNTEEMAKKKYEVLIRKYNELDKEYDYYADKPSNPNSVKKAEEIALEMGKIEKEIDEMKKKFNGILDSTQDSYSIEVKNVKVGMTVEFETSDGWIRGKVREIINLKDKTGPYISLSVNGGGYGFRPDEKIMVFDSINNEATKDSIKDDRDYENTPAGQLVSMAISKLNITSSNEIRSRKNELIEMMSKMSNGYSKMQLGWFIDNYLQYVIKDSIKDSFAILHPKAYEFLSTGGKSWVKEDSTNIQKFATEEEALEFGKKYVNGQFRLIKLVDSIKDSNFEEYLDHLSKFGVKYKEVPNNRSNGIAYEISYIKYATGLEITSTAKKFGKRIISQEPGRIVIGDSVKDSYIEVEIGQVDKEDEPTNVARRFGLTVQKVRNVGHDGAIYRFIGPRQKLEKLQDYGYYIYETIKDSTKDSKLAKIIAIVKKIKTNKQ